MRFRKKGNPTVQFVAVPKERKSYGAVRCGCQKSGDLRCGSVRFSDIKNPTMRFGAVVTSQKYKVRIGAVLTNQKCYGAVRRGTPFNVFSTARFQFL